MNRWKILIGLGSFAILLSLALVGIGMVRAAAIDGRWKCFPARWDAHHLHRSGSMGVGRAMGHGPDDGPLGRRAFRGPARDRHGSFRRIPDDKWKLGAWWAGRRHVHLR